ncbi:IS3 family transposase [Iodobacter sp. HSC-16F04]|uniref:IS3 family transposase n=1 Tax=Iodobacter violaceini TaxID=3044271 RepID=A0ABX0KML5_9NEIS|nr:IS3 family transposase [Iodobacter violacea]NHQ84861.1 IS3 family transposase [Iodobacter violacea]
MYKSKRYTEEFKIEAVKQVTERNYPVAEVAERLGVSGHSIYSWIKRYANPVPVSAHTDLQQDEIRQLKAELRRVTEERDIPKKGRRVLCQAVRVKYAFIREHQAVHPVRRLCRMMQVHPSGYYAWLRQPQSLRSLDDQRLTGVITASWQESGGVYGYRKISADLRDLGEQCGKHRVARLMRLAGLRSQTGYRRRRGFYGGRPIVTAPNHLDRQFAVTEPNRVWVTDITYIRTHEGWLYLAAVLDLFSRQVVGWSMGARMDRELAIKALLMAVWRRKPDQEVLVHSDQGSQFSSNDWQDLLRAHNLKPSMSRRGNCHDNAVAESFFQLLKRERIKRQTYRDREEARRDVFNYIEMFYNPKRRHSFNNGFSPVEYEKQYFERLGSV